MRERDDGMRRAAIHRAVERLYDLMSNDVPYVVALERVTSEHELTLAEVVLVRTTFRVESAARASARCK